ncbi:MAG: TRAP transporter large permease [Chromatiales bacterium]|jgi:C4-dicarboxylate transporter DctM subunit|nr:TRAP transporter large permease [Chromatiales bacterium]MDX9766106.1 TRAP transporter large permease [Ectothiorhodospiraceae bacterium]
MSFLLLLCGVLLLLLTGLPVFAGLALFGGALLFVVQGDLGALGEVVFGELNRYLLVAIPLFALMAHIMIRGRLVDDLYHAAHTFTRHLPGGIGIATVAACTLFAAVSGSSVATALTIGAVAIPQMIHYGYSPRMAYGLVAAGGTLGILIPPSSPMVLYGVVTETSIGALFMAGLLPGLMIAALFALWCLFDARRNGRLRVEPRADWHERMRAARRAVWVLGLPLLVLGGMYLGVFTATEAAGIGALAALLIAVVAYRPFGWRALWAAATDASRTTAMLFMILAGASVFGHVLAKLRVPQEVVALVTALDLGAGGFLLAAMLLILILGMFLDTIAIILVTTPVLLPVMAQLGIHPVWYGVLLMINLELALITPPVGMNLFAIKGIDVDGIGRAPMGEIVRGVLPYVLLLALALLLVFAVPQLALWLPGTRFG